MGTERARYLPVSIPELRESMAVFPKSPGSFGFGPRDAGAWGTIRDKGMVLSQLEKETERRRWPRLPLAIPVFVRSRDENGKDSLELATAVNVSAGGALVAVRRALPLAARVSLEVPTPPSPATASAPKASRVVRARAVRITLGDGYQLTGLKFLQPLLKSEPIRKPAKGKVASSV